ncbi:MAG: hypothetical protein QMB52_13030, partial [Propionivibrio sp.]
MPLSFVRNFAAFGWLLLAAAIAPAVMAQERPLTPEQQQKQRAANAECFSCHSAEGLKAPPKEGLDLRKLRGLLQHPESFYQSDHQKLLCTKCHNEG